MRSVVTGATFSLLLVCAGCQSKPQATQAKPSQPDPNKQHWEGSTEVLKSYRFPNSSSIQKTRDFSFRDKSTTKKKAQETTAPQ